MLSGGVGQRSPILTDAFFSVKYGHQLRMTKKEQVWRSVKRRMSELFDLDSVLSMKFSGAALKGHWRRAVMLSPSGNLSSY